MSAVQTKAKIGSNIDIRFWVSASLLLALLFSVWTISLIVTNNEEYNRAASRATELVNALLQMGLSIQNLGTTAAESRSQAAVFDVDWVRLYQENRRRAERLMEQDEQVNGIRETLAQCDAMVAKAISLREERKGLAPESAEAAQARKEFLAATVRATDAVGQSLKTVRSHYALVVQELNTNWRNLRFLVATSCLLVFAVVCLFRMYRVDRIHQERIQEELTSNNSKLESALAEARESSEVRMQILRNVSHEVRTPMNGVLGMADLLVATDLTAEQRDLAETIRQSGESLLAEVDGMLDYSAIRAGKLELENVAFSLREEVESLLELEAQAAAAKGLDLNYLIENPVPEAVRGDPARLKQVLVNLTANATKFTERGEVMITVSLAEESTEEALVRFEVRDTGSGVSPAALPVIFEPFSQADMTISRKHAGMGLGLAIAKELVEKMGGNIHVESRPGIGSTFWFTARLGRQRVSAPAAPYCLRNRHLLVVDGSAARREVVRHLVSGWHMRSAEAMDGAEALRRLTEAIERGAPFEAVILDEDVHEMRDLGLATTIQATVAAAPRLLLLARLKDGCPKEMLDEAGISWTLSKPVRGSELREVLQKVFEGLPAGVTVARA